MKSTVRLAELNIGITSLHDEVHRLCADYIIKDAAEDITVCTTQEDIDLEREKSAAEKAREGLPDPQYSDAYLETLAVYRKIAEKLPEHDAFLFHGSAVAVDGQAYLFAAPSGTGKSTHARLWRELLGERAVMINDDKPIIRVREKTAFVFGTPWDGSHHLSSNISVPLRAVCLLERGAENSISEITKAEAYPLLLQQTYRPADPAALEKTLSLLERLHVRYYCLQCNMEPGAAALAYNAMKGKER